jgi:hypothetical protein
VAGEDVQESWTRPLEGWALSELRGKVTGHFSFCSISTFYTAKSAKQKRTMRADEVRMTIMWGGKNNMAFTLAGAGWTTTDDKEYALKMHFSDGRYYTIKATGLSSGGVMAIFEPHAEWLKRMMLKSSVDIYINGKWIGDFRLDGSAAAIKELMQCAATGLAENGSGDTFDSKPANETF